MNQLRNVGLLLSIVLGGACSASADEGLLRSRLLGFAPLLVTSTIQSAPRRNAPGGLNRRSSLDRTTSPRPRRLPRVSTSDREGVARGKVETVGYHSTTVGTDRKMLVYTPPGYSTEERYPVLYLLHGIGGDEEEWRKHGSPAVILDNLYAENKIAPMIVVMPNGRAQKNDRAEGDVFRHAKAFETFESDLLKDVIPFIEKNYPVKTGARTGRSPGCRWEAASRSTSVSATSTTSPGSADSPPLPTRSPPSGWSRSRTRPPAS